jgi:thiamine-phosphate pyrophosphorylase
MAPLLPTGSKREPGPPFGLVRLQQWTVLAHQWAPVVAIGGITTSNAAKIWSAGADGIAVISAVAGVKDKQKACAALRSGQKGTGA